LSELKPRRTWPQRLLISLNVFLIVVCLTTAGAVGYLYSKVRDIGRIQGISRALTPVADSGPGHVENFLIVGTDSGEGLDPKDPVLVGRPGGVRTDTIMILRLDPASDHAQLLSLPRDLYVPISGLHASDRINTAIQGGPSRLIETIKDDFGIPINHYIEINFFAFRQLVSAIDGVPMYFPAPVRDLKSGLDVAEPGCITLDPIQALAFARSRAYEYYENGRWKTDPTGDYGRVSRQQEFIRKVILRAIDKGARNPVVLNDLIGAGVEAVNHDSTLTADDLLEVGKRFKDINPDTLETYSVPTLAANIRGGAVLLVTPLQAEPIFRIFRGVETTAPDGVQLLVLNGTGAAGGATTAAEQLRKAGFGVPDGYTGNAERFDFEQTTIRYLASGAERARLVASYLAAPPVLEEVTFLLQSDVNLVVGADWQGVRTTPGPLPDLPASTTTSTSVPGGKTTTTTSTSSTTTTIVGVVPAAPPDVRC
jgi:LCP family protein required for cell wall assembly